MATDPGSGQSAPIVSASATGLRDQARRAASAGQWATAADLWAALLAQLPGDAEALKGLNDAQAAMNQASSIDRVRGDAAVQREEAQVEFDTLLRRADEQFSRGDYSGAERSITTARVTLDKARAVLSSADYDARTRRAQDLLDRVKAAETMAQLQSQQSSRTEAQQKASEQQKAELEQRQKTINENLLRVRQLQMELKYDQALEVLQETLFIDPNNPAALALRDIIETSQLYRRYADLQRQRAFAFEGLSQAALEAMIPPKVNISGPGPRSTNAVVTYPEDWKQLSLRRDTAAGYNESEANRQTLQTLQRPIGLDFVDTELSQVFDYFQKVTGLDFYIEWRSLGSVNVTQTTPVNLVFKELRADAALKMVLDAAMASEGGGVQTDPTANRADWTVEEGVVIIASSESLQLRRVTVVYDVRDLLFEAPYFDNAPDFAIDTALAQGMPGMGGGGGGGGFGGGGGGGMGGGGGAGGGGAPFGAPAGDAERADKGELFRKLQQVIRNIVPQGNWDIGGATEGRMDEFNGNLIVTATPKTHRDITNLFSQLRAVRAIQINIESRLISVALDWFEQIGIDFDLYFNTNSSMFDFARDQDPNFQLRDFFFQNPPGPANTEGVGNVGRLKSPVIFNGFGQNGQNFPDGNTLNTGSAGAPPNPGGDTLDYGYFGPANGGVYNPIGVRRAGDSYGGAGTSNGIAPVNVQQEGLPLITALGQAALGQGSTFARTVLNNPVLSVGFTYLDDVQVDLLVQASQADQRNMVLSAPRLTMFNGQRSWISFARRQSYVANVQPVLGNASGAFSPVIAPIYDGFVLDIEAVASADRRYVTMTVEYAQNQFERFDTASVSGAAGGGDFTGRSAQFAATIQLPVVNAQQVQTTVTVPDKGTILLGGERKLTEVEVEVGVPVLSKVPFVNRFFTNTLNSKTETTVLLLIRPEVIVLQEAEDQLFPGLRDEMNQSTQMSGY